MTRLTFTPKIDVYAYGVMLWGIEWRCQTAAAPRLSPEHFRRVYALIERCKHPDPDQRATFDEIISEFKSIQEGRAFELQNRPGKF